MAKAAAVKKVEPETPLATPTAKPRVAKAPTLEQASIPIGAVIRYTGKRTQYAGQVGTVTGYRGPTTGLWVQFPSGKGSISVKGAELVTPGEMTKPAGKAASRVAKPKAAKPVKTKGKASGQAEAQSA